MPKNLHNSCLLTWVAGKKKNHIQILYIKLSPASSRDHWSTLKNHINLSANVLSLEFCHMVTYCLMWRVKHTQVTKVSGNGCNTNHGHLGWITMICLSKINNSTVVAANKVTLGSRSLLSHQIPNSWLSLFVFFQLLLDKITIWIMINETIVSVLRDKQALFEKVWNPWLSYLQVLDI